MDPVPCGIDPVISAQANRLAGLDYDLRQRLLERSACRDPARNPQLIGPNGDLNLSISVAIDARCFLHNGIGNEIAKLIRMPGQDGFTETDHDGSLFNCV
jgi:hypothetical protein